MAPPLLTPQRCGEKGRNQQRLPFYRAHDGGPIPYVFSGMSPNADRLYLVALECPQAIAEISLDLDGGWRFHDPLWSYSFFDLRISATADLLHLWGFNGWGIGTSGSVSRHSAAEPYSDGLAGMLVGTPPWPWDPLLDGGGFVPGSVRGAVVNPDGTQLVFAANWADMLACGYPSLRGSRAHDLFTAHQVEPGKLDAGWTDFRLESIASASGEVDELPLWLSDDGTVTIFSARDSQDDSTIMRAHRTHPGAPFQAAEALPGFDGGDLVLRGFSIPSMQHLAQQGCRGLGFMSWHEKGALQPATLDTFEVCVGAPCQ